MTTSETPWAESTTLFTLLKNYLSKFRLANNRCFSNFSDTLRYGACTLILEETSFSRREVPRFALQNFWYIILCVTGVTGIAGRDVAKMLRMATEEL